MDELLHRHINASDLSGELEGVSKIKLKDPRKNSRIVE